MKRLSLSAVIVLLALVAAYAGGVPALAQGQGDPVVQKIIQLGTTDNQVMKWNDYASNRFGGRETGTNAYTDATQWAVWQFKQFGIDAELDEVGEVPVGFNRGPWFGRVLTPAAKELRFGTPSFTAGTKGVQHGAVVILKADPFTTPRPAPGTSVNQDEVRKNREAAAKAAIAEINANKAAFKDKWVLIGGSSNGFSRDGRRANSPDAAIVQPVSKALADAGALGTIQSAAPTATPSKTMAGQSEPSLQMLDGYVESWDKLPVLPDIKLLNTQYDEIKAMAEKNQPVELEFDIRNWFKMGPIKYHNVVATIRGSELPDEYIVMGGHFDCFSAATGGIDNGSGFATSMEAMRLIKAAGGHPKRSIVMILFAAEENGLVGSQSWLKKHPELHSKIVMMINRDHTPGAIVGASVPETWYPDFQKITAPLASVDSKWHFTLAKAMPRPVPERAGGTDSSSFMMQAIPALGLSEDTDYTYNYAWHTLNDLYSELVPYTEHQQHTALATAVMAYGVANLDKPLTRAGTFLSDGIYATFTVGAPDKPPSELRQFMVKLDPGGAPLYTANFVRIVEGNAPLTAGRAGQGPPPGVGGGGRGGFAQLPPIGSFLQPTKDAVNGSIVSDTQKKVAVKALPKQLNGATKHDGAGVLGMTSPNGIYLTLKPTPGFDRKYTALGKVIAGADVVAQIKKGDAIRRIQITRVGKAAADFKTDDESFKKLLDAATGKKTTTRP